MNLRPLGPQPSALPSYAIPRANFYIIANVFGFEKPYFQKKCKGIWIFYGKISQKKEDYQFRSGYDAP